MPILLTLVESTQEAISGIPRYITITSSEPAIIYYTIDGTIPTTDALVSDGKIYLPTNQNSVKLKYNALYADGLTDTYEEIYQTIYINTRTGRKGGEDGINIFDGTESVLHYYNSSGEQMEMSRIPIESMELKTSRYDQNGIFVDTTKSFINFVDNVVDRNKFKDKSSTSDIDFDRNASIIVVDGSSQEKMEAQIVQVVNRPYNSMNARSPIYKYNIKSESLYLTGNLIRYIYNGSTGEVIFYYFDSRENRWIKSIQKTDKKVFDFSRISPSRNRQVYRWVKDPTQVRLR